MEQSNAGQEKAKLSNPWEVRSRGAVCYKRREKVKWDRAEMLPLGMLLHPGKKKKKAGRN